METTVPISLLYQWQRLGALKVHSKPFSSTPLFTDIRRVYKTHLSLLGSVRAKNLDIL